ncbi:hypothetical protein BST61_g10577 [Cercospora zeina]
MTAMASSGVPHFYTEEYYATTFTIEGLRALVAYRLQIDVQDHMTKYKCIQMLMDKDRKVGRWTGPFRFHDLPGELRNMVYTELLRIPTASSGVSRQKLKANTYYEVTTNSLGESHMHCYCDSAFSVKNTPWDIDEKITLFRKVLVHLNLGIDKENPLIRVDKATRYTTEAICKNASQYLYHLVSNLANSPVLKFVDISVDISNFTAPLWALTRSLDDMLRQTLLPLTLLGESRFINFAGVPSNVEQYIKANLEATEIERSQTLFDRLETANEHISSCAEAWRETWTVIEECEELDVYFVDVLMDGIREMEALLAHPKVAELDRLWTDWTSRRYTRNGKKAVLRMIEDLLN